MQNESHTTAPRRICFLVLVQSLAMVMTWGCTHRGDGELNVDRVQGYANAIERNVRDVKSALGKSDLELAEDKLEEAEEILSDNEKELEAYPEIDQLSDSVSRARVDVCFGHVKIALDNYFSAIDKKNAEDAAELLLLAHKEHDRCKDTISHRPEYLALKMNLDTAGESLDKLKVELARPALLKKIQQAKEPLEGLKKQIVGKLKSLESRPDQRKVAVEIHSLIQQLNKAMDENPGGLGPDWKAYMSKLRSQVAGFQARRDALVRRGKVLLVVRKNLPEAEKNIKKSFALRRKDRKRAISIFKDVNKDLDRCKQVLKKEVATEPSLAKYSFAYRGKKRNVRWLIRHLDARMGYVTSLMNFSSGGKKPKKTRRSKRRHRIKRW